MRYLDRIGCTTFEKAKVDTDIKSLGALTRKATKKAEALGLALLRTHWGTLRIIAESGLGGVCDETFNTLEEVNTYLLKINLR